MEATKAARTFVKVVTFPVRFALWFLGGEEDRVSFEDKPGTAFFKGDSDSLRFSEEQTAPRKDGDDSVRFEDVPPVRESGVQQERVGFRD